MILSLFNRLPDSLGDDRRIFVQSEQHRPLEALWASNDHPQCATKWISSNPALGLLFEVARAAGLGSVQVGVLAIIAGIIAIPFPLVFLFICSYTGYLI
jgi:hypothetical protein